MSFYKRRINSKITLQIFALIFSTAVIAQEHRMINDIKEHTSGTTVWWAGQDSWLIKSDNLLIANDLYLQVSGRIDPSPITPDELAEVLDVAFITHEHDDHFNAYTCRILLEKSKCIFVLPESCLLKGSK